jgi:hypothetical protein
MVDDGIECSCDCHQVQGDEIMHVVACCKTCGYCGRNINRDAFTEHLKGCAEFLRARTALAKAGRAQAEPLEPEK